MISDDAIEKAVEDMAEKLARVLLDRVGAARALPYDHEELFDFSAVKDPREKERVFLALVGTLGGMMLMAGFAQKLGEAAGIDLELLKQVAGSHYLLGQQRAEERIAEDEPDPDDLVTMAGGEA